MSKTIKKDAVVLGGGPGGYVAAIRLGQLGVSTALVDRGPLGGVCLNWGCIPSKALIHVAKLYEELQGSSEIGISAKSIQIDLAKTQEWKRSIIKKLTDNVGQLAKSNGVEVIRAEAVFDGPNRMRLKGRNGGDEMLEFKSAIVATGSKTIEIPGFAIDGKIVVDAKEALDWTKAPKHLLVIGGGVIGLEIGMMYQKFGSQITVVEMMDQLLPGVDTEVAQWLNRICRKKGITVHLSAKAIGYKKAKNGVSVEIQTPKGKETINCDVILLSVGRKPHAAGLGLEKIGVKIHEKGFIPVNQHLQTNLSHIYAIGDVIGPPLLAHKASKEGLIAAENIAGHPEVYDVRAMPGAIFTDPEVATVGLSEEQAKEKGIPYIIGKFPFAALGRAVSTGHPEGFAKIVAEKGTGVVIGGHIIGAGAGDLVSELTLAIEMGATIEDLSLTVHPHPTLSESIMESAEAAVGKAIHIINRSLLSKERSHELS